MKFIKLGIISFIVLFFLLTALGLLLPSTVRVTRNINIHVPSDSLRSYINDIKNWSQWMASIDAKSVIITSPQTQGRNASANIGKLTVSITKDEKNIIESTWQTNNGKEQLSVFQLYPDSTNSITNLNWYFEQKLHWYPWERLPAIANDKVMGPFMEQSLDKLKTVAESRGN